VRAAQELVERGVREVNAAGQNVQPLSWWHDVGQQLIRTLGKVRTWLERIRIPPASPNDMDDDLIAAHRGHARR